MHRMYFVALHHHVYSVTLEYASKLHTSNGYTKGKQHWGEHADDVGNIVSCPLLMSHCGGEAYISIGRRRCPVQQWPIDLCQRHATAHQGVDHAIRYNVVTVLRHGYEYGSNG